MFPIPTDPMSIFLMITSLTVVGFSKGGLSGMGVLGMPLMAMVFPPVEAGAIMLPLLIVQDAVSVWMFRKSWNKQVIVWMLPGALVGIAVAALFSAVAPISAILALLGVISVAFGLWRLWLIWNQVITGPLFKSEWPGLFFGFASGFTGQIAHAGAPPLQIWLEPRRMPHLEYVGTMAILFAMMNWAKVPAFMALNAFSVQSLLLSALLLPVALISTYVGSLLVRRVRGKGFYIFINLMLTVIGLKLVWDGLVWEGWV